MSGEAPTASSFVKGRAVIDPLKAGKGRVSPKLQSRAKGTEGLTPKQVQFVKGIAQGKTNSQAALDAYNTDSERVASVIAAENLAKPSIREALDLALDKAGITVEKAIEPIKDALKYEGESERDTLDMRLKGSDRALKLMGATQAEKDDEPKSIVNFNFGTQNFVKDTKVSQS